MLGTSFTTGGGDTLLKGVCQIMNAILQGGNIGFVAVSVLVGLGGTRFEDSDYVQVPNKGSLI